MTIFPHETLFTIGAIAIGFVAIWMIAHAADAGRLQRRNAMPAFFVVAAFMCGIFGASDIAQGNWFGTAFFGCGVAYFAFHAWRRSQHG